MGVAYYYGSASLMLIFIALSFLQENISPLNSIELISIFIPHFNSNTHTIPDTQEVLFV